MDAILLAEDKEGTISVCDIDTGARCAQAFRGGAGTVPRRGVAVLGSDHLVAAYKEKPVLHVWTWTKHAQPVLRIPLPGKASAVTCSPCGTFCVCGIDASFYVWEVATGRLLAVVSHHFQPISVLCFTDDGSHLISGGRDGHVLVWNLSDVLSRTHRGELPEHIFHWRDHRMPVTDIYCGVSGRRARVFVASKDSTCCIYELGCGVRICQIIFESSLLAIALDVAEMFLFGAEEKGHLIRKVNFYNTEHLTGQQAVQEEAEGDNKLVCRGHTAAVTCLSVSKDGTTLVSASDDGTARLWQVTECQCLHVFNRQGPISFASFIRLPAVLSQPPRAGSQPKAHFLSPLSLFQRQLTKTAAASSSVAALETCSLHLSGLAETQTKWPLKGKQREDYWKNFLWTSARVEERNRREAGNTEAIKSSPLVKSLQHQLSEMRKVNRRLVKEETQEVLASLVKP